MRFHVGLRFLCLMALAVWAPALLAEERTQRFDRDPGWHTYNNRNEAFAPRKISQDFGYSAATRHAGGEAAGEMGGVVTPAAEAAWYAKVIPTANFEDKLTASGKFSYASGQGHLLIGFFNADTVNEWRTPNTVALRLLGRGDVFYAYVEYTTGKWRAGGDSPGGFATVKDPKTGWLIDFGVMDEAWAEMHALLDHRTLNEVPGLDNSTCENLAAYIWKALRPRIPQLSAVSVWETADGCCVYRGR